MATELFIPIPGQQIPHYSGGIEQMSPYFWKKDRFFKVCNTTTNEDDDPATKIFSITIKGLEITEQDLEVLDIFKRQLRIVNWKQYVTPTRVELDISFVADQFNITEDQLTDTLLEIYKGYNLLGKQFTQNDLRNMHHIMKSYYMTSEQFETVPQSFQFRSCCSGKEFINAPDVYVIP